MPDNPKTVDQIDPGKKTSDVLGPMSEQATVRMDKQNEKCFWNDEEFTQGDQVDLDGECYECSYGRWVRVDD